MCSGTIIKGIGGFYYVRTQDATVECRARGIFRKNNFTPCVGDRVIVTLSGENTGCIDKILERKNRFIRPPISNVDCMVTVVSARDPQPDLTFVDKMLVICALNNTDAVICFNKTDLDGDRAHACAELYSKIGYTVCEVCALNGDGTDSLLRAIDGKIAAFTGFSGVGKSSILNAVAGDALMETGEVSKKLKRGRHTTRHVELIEYRGGFIADTPGFCVLDLPNGMTESTLKSCFPEFAEYEGQCRFSDCSHTADADICAVRRAVEQGYIARSRYENYKSFLKIITSSKNYSLL